MMSSTSSGTATQPKLRPTPRGELRRLRRHPELGLEVEALLHRLVQAAGHQHEKFIPTPAKQIIGLADMAPQKRRDRTATRDRGFVPQVSFTALNESISTKSSDSALW